MPDVDRDFLRKLADWNAVVESAVAAALGQGASVETPTLFNADSERGFHDVGALLRY
jgi:hypothetical protein